MWIVRFQVQITILWRCSCQVALAVLSRLISVCPPFIWLCSIHQFNSFWGGGQLLGSCGVAAPGSAPSSRSGFLGS